MPETMTDDVTKAIQMFKGLPQERQAALLQQMTPQQKNKILEGLKARTGPAPSLVEGQKQVLASEMEKAQGGATVTPDPARPGTTIMKPSSSPASRARETAIGLLEPFTAESLLGTLQHGGYALYQAMARPADPEAYKPLLEIGKGIITAPIEPVKEFVGGIKEGDYDRMAHGSGGIVSQTLPAVEGAVKTAGKVLPLDVLKEQTRKAAQNLTSSGAFKTTEKTVKDYNAAVTDTVARQLDSDAAIAEKNRAAIDEAAKKTAENAAEFDKAEAAKREGFKEKAAETIESNREALHAAARNEAVNRSIEEGGKRLGESVHDLDLKLREEANGKYDVVKKATAEDPGIPLADMANAAKEAQGLLSGSAESIKQFNELIRKGAEEGDIQAGGMTVKPGDRLYEMLKEQGAINSGEMIGFRDLQGYSSEIGRKLATGGLPGDIYQALKALKEKIDAAKSLIAERNNAGAALRDADSFWHDYQDLFYDRDSAITKVRESVGVKNPGEAAGEFFRGNMDEIAVGKLKRLRSVYAKDANAVADLTLQLRKAREEAAAYKAQRVQEMPKAPKPGERPEPVVSTTTPRKTIAGPEAPTAENIIADKRERIEAKGHSLAEISKYDVGALPIAVAGAYYGHAALGLVPIAAKYGLAFLLKRPSVVEWIARPTAADLIAIDRLPDPVKIQVREGLQQIMDQESAAGRAVKPAGGVQNFMARTAIISRPVSAVGNTNEAVKNRREAMELLGQPTP